MLSDIYVRIIGTGSYIPQKIIDNNYFGGNEFFTPDGEKINESNQDIIKKLQEITGITKRRYIPVNLVTSDMAYLAAKNAIKSIQSQKTFEEELESIDAIIVAHNYGDVRIGSNHSDLVPSIASRVKNKLDIKNSRCLAFDVLCGCPGWLESLIQANSRIISGEFNRALIIGAESLSRVADPHDRDCMIFSDGAGAVIIKGERSSEPIGILSHKSSTDSCLSDLIYNGRSYNPNYEKNDLFIHMKGHKVWKYAISKVPEIVKDSIEEAGLGLDDISKIIIHQANEKMDYKIGENLFKLYGKRNFPKEIMPITVGWLGNSSVATIPTLLDLLLKGKIENQRLETGKNIVFASVGAGMTTNTMVYKL